MDNKGGGKSPYLLALVVFVLGIGLGYLLTMYYPGVTPREEVREKEVKEKVIVSPTEVVLPEVFPSEEAVSVEPSKVEGSVEPSIGESPEISTSLSPGVEN